MLNLLMKKTKQMSYKEEFLKKLKEYEGVVKSSLMTDLIRMRLEKFNEEDLAVFCGYDGAIDKMCSAELRRHKGAKQMEVKLEILFNFVMNYRSDNRG